MVSLVKNVIYLSPAGALALAGAYCLYLFSTSYEFALMVVYSILAISLFVTSIYVTKYAVDSLERIAKGEGRIKLKVEREKTSRAIKKNEAAAQRMQTQKELEERKTQKGREKFGQDILRGLFR